ncbi:hypothetical protein [Spongiimicrobium salis]|uniref:hypothetical protein n=1 Tax=Spongiimicrobium salis TaxID=1667022 RepID=UPI00374D737F
MKKVTIISEVNNGRLKRNRNLIESAIRSFEGKVIEFTIQRKKKSRSNPQNRFYWGVVIPIIQQGLKDCTGEVRDSNSIHYQILLPLFSCSREITNTQTGEIVTEKMTSSEMTTTQFAEYILEIQKWAAEFLGIEVPDPNQELTLIE